MRYKAEGQAPPERSQGTVWAAVGAYAIVMSTFVYLVDSGRLWGEPNLSWAVVGAVALAHVVFGLAIGRWWALLLPLLAIFLAIPAGVPYDPRGEAFPLFFGMAFYAPFEAALLSIGVGTRKLVDWAHSERERDR
jgi:hypothetical protein